MNRKNFIQSTTILGSALALGGSPAFANIFTPPLEEPWFDKSKRWAQLAFVENDPGRYDPDFWLSYFKRIHADGALLSAGGVVAFYPTDVPFHHRSKWLGNTDPLGDMMKGCRKMNMSVILRTDPHATRQDMYDAHPDYISVTADGQKRRHWANPELWVTCAYGPYNFDFMTKVNKEIMERYQPDAIFSNRWAGHGVCYCEHCKEMFRKASGLELPKGGDRLDPTYIKWNAWSTGRLKELWFLWDKEIRKQRASARFIPNGFPDKQETGKYSDFFFADQQARQGVMPPWGNAMGAKELRAGLGMKPVVGIFSVGIEEEYRWKDSVQNDAEIRIWVAEGVANGMLPCFVKFGAYIEDKRWMGAVEKMYQGYYKNERYLNNTAPMARVGMVYSEQTNRKYGGKPWQQKSREHGLGMYHALVEDHMPFEMVNDNLLDAEHLKPFKLLVLPNIAALSDAQCAQLKAFVDGGGSIVATFETSLYNEEGKPRSNFGLSELLGVTYDNGVEGPMMNSYLRIKGDAGKGGYHPVVKGLEDSYKIINTVYQVKVKPLGIFPSPVTLIPTYPDLPMEDVYPRIQETDTREVYLKETGKGRVAYLPGDMDRSFWQMMSTDHSTLLRNTIRWALNEVPVADVETAGIVDVAVWRQKNSMTVHLVNLTNPMMMKGPFRDLLPVEAAVSIRVPANKKVTGVSLLMSGTKPAFENKDGLVTLKGIQILDHEIVALDLA
ncbi:alpha-amylase family protein [Pedobacter hartonius]|uniref:Beta-galactosidase trimerisation domain-containing protein n=1 Tax=Pedobacter hartonius TaxID=425514 RepID=A0A1H4DX42_9SPHI|nr:alpha-amylase family protein [Pedobacter hartonius]SEA77344.1 Beta-galactosidase trimerisation domain-containing protein [Pedobacter hartonius]